MNHRLISTTVPRASLRRLALRRNVTACHGRERHAYYHHGAISRLDFDVGTVTNTMATPPTATTSRHAAAQLVPLQQHQQPQHTRSSMQHFSTAASPECSGDGVVSCKLFELIASGEIQPDDHQLDAAAELDKIYEELMAKDPPPLPQGPSSPLSSSPTSEQASKTSSSSFLGGFFASKQSSSNASSVAKQLSSMVGLSNSVGHGAYMYGGVGCGKTFLMNLFYDAIDSGAWAQDKQKVHYHKFMLQVHQHMHQQRKIDPQGDLIAPVVHEILKQGRLLCLDEFQVTDVADALILQRLFEGLWEEGCILIATSNRPPSDLYLNGLQRDRFLPFIDRLEQECTVVDLLDSETDYRMLSNSDASLEDGRDTIYFTKGQSKAFRKLFFKLTEGHPANPMSLSTQGRRVPIPLASNHKHVAHFEFSDLCKKALGAADYLVIANHFSTVFIHNIPKLTVNELNWLRRFITFVDTMYELKVTLVLHTQAQSVDEIFVVEGDKNEYSQDEVFAFDRTRSRLEEMSSPKYLQSQWLGGSKTTRKKKTSTIFTTPRADTTDNAVVTRRLAHRPSLDNHHQGTTLGDPLHLHQ